MQLFSYLGVIIFLFLVFSNLVDLAQNSNCTRFLTVTGFSKYLRINLTKSTNYTNCQFDQSDKTQITTLLTILWRRNKLCNLWLVNKYVSILLDSICFYIALLWIRDDDLL